MLIYLADLAHTYSTKNESLMIPLNIGYLKAYAMEQHKDKIEIKLFKDPQKLLLSIGDKNPDLVGFANLIELWDTVREIKHLALNQCRDNADFLTYVMGDPEPIQGEGYVMVSRFGYFKLVNRRAFSYANFHNSRFAPMPLRA